MSFAQIESEIRRSGTPCIAVAAPRGEEIFAALKEADSKNLARFLLIGDVERTGAEAERSGLTGVEYLPAETDEEAAQKAVDAVRDGRADILMKGKVASDILLKAALEEKSVFNRGQLLSHVLVLESPAGRMIAVTDGGMNLYPDVEQKQQILTSAVELFHAIGIRLPKVAVLAAVEKENPKMPESLDAAELRRRWERGRIPGCVVDGPLALDLAVSPVACRRKGYTGGIQGDADILVAHDIASGNYLGKSLIHMAGYSAGGVVVGAGRPIVLLSRSDSEREKYQSILLAMAIGVAGGQQLHKEGRRDARDKEPQGR